MEEEEEEEDEGGQGQNIHPCQKKKDLEGERLSDRREEKKEIKDMEDTPTQQREPEMNETPLCLTVYEK